MAFEYKSDRQVQNLRSVIVVLALFATFGIFATYVWQQNEMRKALEAERTRAESRLRVAEEERYNAARKIELLEWKLEQARREAARAQASARVAQAREQGARGVARDVVGVAIREVRRH